MAMRADVCTCAAIVTEEARPAALANAAMHRRSRAQTPAPARPYNPGANVVSLELSVELVSVVAPESVPCELVSACAPPCWLWSVVEELELEEELDEVSVVVWPVSVDVLEVSVLWALCCVEFCELVSVVLCCAVSDVASPVSESVALVTFCSSSEALSEMVEPPKRLAPPSPKRNTTASAITIATATMTPATVPAPEPDFSSRRALRS